MSRAERPVFSAAIRVLAEPPNASSTISPRREQSRSASAIIATGLTVGCMASSSERLAPIESFASKLHELRIARRLSLQDVATAVGISKAHVFNLEKGLTANPSMELVVKLAELFRVRVADLVGDNPDADDQPAEVVAMFRDLKNLSEGDRETIKMMMETLKKRREQER